MNFTINEFGERPNGRKSWDKLSGERQRKLRKIHNDRLDKMVNADQNKSSVDHYCVNNNVDSEDIERRAVGIPNSNCHIHSNQEKKFSVYDKKIEIFNVDRNEILHADVPVTALENKNQNQKPINSCVQNSQHNNMNVKSAEAHANTNGTTPCNPENVSYDEATFKLKLSKCIIDNNINLTQSKALLEVLRTHPNFTFLPKDPRSLLSTPRQKVKTKTVAPGEYLHIGLELMLGSILSRVHPDLIPDELKIDFSTDGAEANSKIQMWPIQVRAVNVPYDKPELVGVYTGESKPSSFADFFSDFITEVNKICLNGGISYGNRLIPIQVRCFIADAPARAYVLNHKTHIAEFPCSKCYVGGITFNHSKRFPGVDHTLRNDVDYRNMADKEHHNGVSALNNLAIDHIKQVPFDYMHMVCLGVMKKFVESVAFGKCKPKKLDKFLIDALSNRLITLQMYCPREFARNPRELSKYIKYKATEFRQLLLYTFIVVFNGIIDDVQYEHFLLLHVSMRILLNNSSSPEAVQFAKEALNKFVEDAESIHGLEFLTYNTHGLTHLTLDYEFYGQLDSVSAFVYENSMKMYRGYFRKNNQLLQQVYNRTQEQLKFSALFDKNSDDKEFKAYEIHSCGPIISGLEESSIQYENIQTSTFFYSIQSSDNTIITESNQIGIIKNIFSHNNVFFFAVSFFKKLKSYYSVSKFPSTNVGVYLCTSLDTTITFITYNEIKSKCYRMPIWVKKRLLNAEMNDEMLNNAYVAVVM